MSEFLPDLGLSKEKMLTMCKELSKEEIVGLIAANNHQIYKDLTGKIYQELKKKALSDRDLCR